MLGLGIRFPVPRAKPQIALKPKVEGLLLPEILTITTEDPTDKVHTQKSTRPQNAS